eukprot:SAG31_NODE_71_length_28115_cov_4.128105_14_plen_535_part_00
MSKFGRSYLYSKHTKAQIFTVIFNIFLGLVLMIAQFIMDQIDSTREVNKQLMTVYRLSPGFCLGHGLWQLSIQDLTASYLGKSSVSPLSSNIAGTDALRLFFLGPLYLAIGIALDYACSYPAVAVKLQTFTQNKLADITDPPYTEDDDVMAERERVDTNGPMHDALIQVCNLRKVYGPVRRAKVAVVNVSFAVEPGECFGYLGVNGAGKTTTMKCLTGDCLPTNGRAYLGGHDILTEQRAVRRLLGYCPQFDALLDRLTVREHLQLFARIKGVAASKLASVVNLVMQQMQLQDFENKLAGTLSGGNKRKLSVGIAMIGSPKIIFLDEPSTGVDPVARRFLWNVINRICVQRRDCCIVLTSHVMEEVEALCTRVGIMSGGRLRCLGSIQHLKGRFGHGYQLEVKAANPSTGAVSAVTTHVLSNGQEGQPVERPGLLVSELPSLCEELAAAILPGMPHGLNHEQWGGAWTRRMSEAAAGQGDAESGQAATLLRQTAEAGRVSSLLFAEWWLGELAVRLQMNSLPTHSPYVRSQLQF